MNRNVDTLSVYGETRFFYKHSRSFIHTEERPSTANMITPFVLWYTWTKGTENVGSRPTM